jgi:phosphoglycerate dehydrogenase-like enzyme
MTREHDMLRIALLDDWQNAAREMADWDSLGAEVTVFGDHLADEDALVERLAPFEVLGVMRERTPLPASLLGRLPNLRLIVTTGMRNAAIDMDATARLGITVCGTPSPGHSTAELTMGLVIALFRNLHIEAWSMRSGGWQVGLGRDLKGATIGLLGLGRLGGMVAQMAAALGMSPIAWSQNLTQERAAEVGARLVTREALFRESDVVSIHLKLSGRTRGLVGAAELGLMRPDAYLVNTSRGPIVDEAALLAALSDRRIAGAAIDVYDVEPLPPEHPLRAQDNALLTPHIGYVTRETWRVWYGEMVELIRAWRAGTPRGVIACR